MRGCVPSAFVPGGLICALVRPFREGDTEIATPVAMCGTRLSMGQLPYAQSDLSRKGPPP